MLKKMTLLAMAVAAIAAFAVPASASAATDWTDNGAVVANGVDISQGFEGKLQFAVSGVGTFGCEVTIKITITGPTSAEITQFNPTTSTCVGTGAFEKCKLKSDKSTVPWTITNGATTLAVTASPLTVFNEYEAGCGVGATSDLVFEAGITVTPTLVEGRITSLAIAGTSTSGAVASGSVVPEAGSKTIGLK
jgi:hypothetical protein